MILDYIYIHKKDIENDMNSSLKNIKKQGALRKEGERKTRQELSLSATRGLSRTNIHIKLEGALYLIKIFQNPRLSMKFLLPEAEE